MVFGSMTQLAPLTNCRSLTCIIFILRFNYHSISQSIKYLTTFYPFFSWSCTHGSLGQWSTWWGTCSKLCCLWKLWWWGMAGLFLYRKTDINLWINTLQPMICLSKSKHLFLSCLIFRKNVSILSRPNSHI